MTRSNSTPPAARWRRGAAVGLAALVLVGAMSGRAVAAPTLPPPGPLGYQPTALLSVTGQVFAPSRSGNPISATDRIAGVVVTPQGQDVAQQAAVFYVANRTVRILHPPGSAWATAVDINDRGQVTGTAHFAGGGEQTYLWTSRTNTYQLLGSLGGYFSRPAALNNSGVVVGLSTSAVGGDHAFLYDPAVDHGRLRDLDTRPGYVFSAATGVDDAGDVVGYLGEYPGGLGTAFLWRPTANAMTDLGRPTAGDNATWATDINDQGVVVGGSAYQAPFDSTDVSRPSRGFVLNPVTHRFRVLPSRSGYASVATAVNHHGIIVGTSGVDGDNSQALLWNACGTPLQVLAQGGYGTGVYGVNRHEHLVGTSPDVFWRRNDGPCLPQGLVAR